MLMPLGRWGNILSFNSEDMIHVGYLHFFKKDF